MAWTPFSYEAVQLHALLGRLDKQGRTSDALEAINQALEKAHREGPSNITYEESVAEWEASNA